MPSPVLTALATIGLALSAFVADEAFAFTPETAVPALTAEAAHDLQPGQFLWRADEEAGSPLIVISLPQQRLFLFQDGRLAGISTVSTGRRGHRTPAGYFQILEKRRKHRSNLYDDAPMPFTQRLTWDGVALHAGIIPGRPASHGCVRLPTAFAKLLFGLTRVGSTVVITEAAVEAGTPVTTWFPEEPQTTAEAQGPVPEAPLSGDAVLATRRE